MTDYLTVIEVLAIHHIMIKRYGGSHGIRDMGALEAACFRPQTGYYEDVIAEAAALMESLAINHPFIDGNKRVAFGAADLFLRINSYRIHSDSSTVYRMMLNLFETGAFEFKALEAFMRQHVKPIQ